MATMRRPRAEAVISLELVAWVVPMIAREVKTSIARAWPHFMAKVRAAKNMPSRFSPVSMPSASATSATMAWGMMPSRAMGKAATMQISTPGSIPVRKGSTPIRAVMV